MLAITISVCFLGYLLLLFLHIVNALNAYIYIRINDLEKSMCYKSLMNFIASCNL